MPRIALLPGQTSIDSVTPKQEPNGSWVVQWSIRLHDGKLLPPRKTRGKTKGEARRKAKAKADQLLLTSGNAGKFQPTDPINDYIKDVSLPLVENSNLRPATVDRYKTALMQLTKQFAGYSITNGLRFRTLESKLQTIAKQHGTESARHARGVMSKYVIQQLIRDDLAAGNPLTGMSIDLGNHRVKNKPRGGQALTAAEYDRVLDYFLARDPSTDVERPIRGMYTLEHRIGVYRSAIDTCLLQMTTGLRIKEVRTLTWDNVEVIGNQMHVTITPDVSKTKKGRTVPVLDERVVAHLLARKLEIGGQMVIGAPANPDAIWDQSNAQKAVTQVLREAGIACKVPLLSTVASHVWRATLNSMYLTQIPEVVRAAYFGHDVAMNRGSYTDLTDTSILVEAAKKRRESI